MKVSERPIQRRYRFRDIVEKIQQMISRGLVSPGERLPAERHLAAEFDVSRATVREALRVVEQKGLVDIRRGRKGGAYVKTPSSRQLGERMDMLLQLDRLTLDQIAEYRVAIEVGITTQAARIAGPEDIRMLKCRLAAARSCMAKGSVDGFIEADKAVHLCIAHVAGNPLFTHSLAAALGMGHYFSRFLKLNPSFMQANYRDLADIVEAMDNQQPETAGGLTRSHISRFNQAVV